MKRFLALLFFGITLLSACSGSDTDDDIPTPVPPTPVAKEHIDIDAGQDSQRLGGAEAGTLELIVTSSSDWSLTISDTRTGIDWISASVTEGKAGETTVAFDISENILRTTRTAYIKLKNSAGSTTVVYSQNPYDPANLTLSVTELAVGHEAVRKTFTLKSDIAWTFTSGDESLCNISPMRGNAGEYTITAAITENTSETKRSTVLTAKAGYETATILIEQECKKPELNIDKGIRTLDDLCRFRDAVNEGGNLAEWKYNGEINLLDNIDLSYVENWIPIGSEKVPFTGIFNGNGFTLSNLRVLTQTEYAGLFGYATDATIKNLHLEHADVESTYVGTNLAKVAGICGRLDQKNMTAKIDNCTVSGYMKAPEGSCGICGNIYESTVSNCTNYAIATFGIGRTSDSGGARLISCTDCGFTTYPGWREKDTDCVDEAYSLPEAVYTQLFGDKRLYSKDEIAAELVTEKSLRCANIAMRNMRILELMPNIIALTCRNCSLSSDLDLSHNPSLNTVYCSGNDLLESIDVSECPNLSILDATNNPNLETIWISARMMSAIPWGFSKDANTSYRIKGGTLTYNPNNDAYEIHSIYDLIEYSQITNRQSNNVSIMNDLDFSGTSLSLKISNDGIFEGNNRKITNLPGQLFTSNTGTIRNITLENSTDAFCYRNSGMISNITLLNSSSNLCECNKETGIIEHCQVTASIREMLKKYIGGVCNENYGTLRQCHANINVLCIYHCYGCGGLCGYNSGIISQCSSKGKLYNNDPDKSEGYERYGGLVGEHTKGKISECFSSCEIIGGETKCTCGGLIGHVSSEGVVYGCYATGKVSEVGGALIGSNYGYVYGCYATSASSDFVDTNAKGAKLEYCAYPEGQIYEGEGSDKGSVSQCKDVRSVVADGCSAIDANAASWWSSSYISRELYKNAVTNKCPKLAWESER